MKHADNRPRIHLWPSGRYWTYSLGPVAMRQGGSPTRGTTLDQAIANLGARAARGVVVIVEPVDSG